MRDERPVIRKAVQFLYKGEEIVNLVRAAHLLPPFKIELGLSELKIEYHSLTTRNWLCSFKFSRAPGTNLWTLRQIEYDLGTTLRRALSQLGELEERGLKRIKHGL